MNLADYRRSAETLHLREFLTRVPTDISPRTRLNHATVLDPPRPARPAKQTFVDPNRAAMIARNGPQLDAVTRTYTDPKPRPSARPNRPRPQAFSPRDEYGTSTFYDVYDASNGQHMFKVRGTKGHALGEAARFTKLPTYVVQSEGGYFT